MLGPTGHTDTFTRDRLPLAEDWPEFNLQGFDYPDWLNAGVELTDAMVDAFVEIRRAAGLSEQLTVIEAAMAP